MPSRRSGSRDLLVLAAVVVLLLALATLTSLDDHLHAWLGEGRHPLDEVLFTLVLLSVSSGVFYLRRTRELHALEHSYRGLFDTVTEAIYVQDAEGRFLDVNRAVLAMYGYTREEMIGQTPAMLADPERVDVEATLAAVRKAYAGEPQRFEWWARRKNGERFAKEVTITRGTYFGQDVLIAVARETTEQKRAEERLRESERRYRLLSRASNDAIWEWDPATGALTWSDAFGTRFGYAPEEVEHTLEWWAARVHPDDLPEVRGTLHAAFENGAAGWQEEYRFRRRDGSWAQVIDRGYVLRDADGVQRRMIGSFRDVSEHKYLEEQLRLAQKMEAVGRLAGGIAHDFNNLLTAIGGTTEVVLDEMATDDPLRADLLEVKRATNRAAALTRQLLAFSRMQVLRPRVLSLNATVGEMERMLTRLLGADVVVTTELDAHLGCVRADPSQIEQVVLNLAVNARDAMPRGGRLVIATRDVELDESWAKRYRYVKPGPYVMLSVTDTGTGMGAELREKIFEPFFTTKEAGKGTGLGLSTVYGIVKQSDGYIWVESEPGHGSTFRVYLPRVEGTPEPEGTGHGRSSPAPEAATILLVEDEDSVRSLARRVLQRHGYTVLEAPDAPAALELSAQYAGSIDLLLTDMRMPGLNGHTLAERLAGQRPGLGVLFMSGYTEHRAELPAGSERAAFLQKPFSASELLASVQALLGALAPSGS
jgi:PAS domain S-box-containing protein